MKISVWVGVGDKAHLTQELEVPDPKSAIVIVYGCRIFRYDKENVTYHKCGRHPLVIVKWYGDVQEGEEDGQSNTNAAKDTTWELPGA